MPSGKDVWFPAESGHPPAESVQLLQAIAHKTRLELISMLITEGKLSAGVLQHELEISQPNLAYHVRLLRQARIITVRHTEFRAYYQVTDPRIAIIINALKS